MHNKRGFTLMEILVSVVVAGVALLVTMIVAGSMTKQLANSHLTVSAQDNARNAVDEVARTLRSAGSGTDYSNGQSRFLAAAPYTVALNANLQPASDPFGTATPAALNVAFANASVPLDAGASYTPARNYSTGAETIVLTLDSNRDGQVTESDATDDEEEQSANPRDFVLKEFVYGSNGAANTVTNVGLGVLRGPIADSDGSHPEPLFRYWVDTDNDPKTPATLYGDGNGDGKLSQTEIAALGPVPASQLGLIERVEIAATAESDKAKQGSSKYVSTVLRSSVSFRNRNNTAAHVDGKVFHDVNRNGIQDSGEVPLKDVVVRCSNGLKSLTATDGHYNFAMTPGTYTITEIDAAGYSSTTPNTVNVTPGPGDYVVVNFGDISTLGTGRISGQVYEDKNQNGVPDAGERALQGVQLNLDSGASAITDMQGKYKFTVTTKTYTLTEVDSAGYASSTPNVVGVTLRADGDSAIVNFGDYKLDNSGRIHGIVYNDTNHNGVKEASETGIANVAVGTDGGHFTNTDSKGEFLFNVPPGDYVVTETDPAGYTSSTPNELDQVHVTTAQTVEVAFGDIGQQDISFQEILLGNTQRALSIASFETGEDNKNDIDLALGTQYVSGSNDILVWWNGRTNSSTPNSALFKTTADYSRTIALDINAVSAYDLTGDGRGDLVSGLGGGTNNIAVWTMQGGGNKGQLPTNPTASYTASMATRVDDIVLGKFDADATMDLAVGTRTGASAGKLEIWHGGGGTSFTRATKDIFAVVPGTAIGLGEVVSLATADFNADGKGDLVLGTRISNSASVVYLFLYGPNVVSGSDYYMQAAIPVQGQVNDVLALDMVEDNQHTMDILVATETSPTAGEVQLWLNRGDNTFGMGSIPSVTPDDTANPGGSPLSLAAARVDNDVFPDLIVGTRSSSTFNGQVLVYRGYGYLPSSGTLISDNLVGEVITMTTNDFNQDGAVDMAAGTRTSGSTGKVVIFFNTTH